MCSQQQDKHIPLYGTSEQSSTSHPVTNVKTVYPRTHVSNATSNFTV